MELTGITIDDAVARYVGANPTLTRQKLVNWLNTGKVMGYKQGGRVYVIPASLERYLQERNEPQPFIPRGA